MFRECINNPIDPIPAEYVRSLKRPNNEPDYSLTCLGIAMLKSRIEDYQGLDGTYSGFTSEESCVQDFLVRADAADAYPVLCYYKYSNAIDEQDCIKQLKENGFEIKDTVGLFLSKKCDTKGICVYHPTKNIGGFFVNSQDFRIYHMVISFISLALPGLFAEKPLTDEDKEVIKALSKTSKDAFIMRIQESVKPYIAEFRRMMLTNLIKAMHEMKIAKAKQDVDRCRRDVEDAERVVVEAIRNLKGKIVIFEGMKATESYDQPEEDLVEYLTNNKQVRNLNISGNVLSFTVSTLLNNYNSDAWDIFKDRGHIYDGRYNTNGQHNFTMLDVFKTKENRKILLDNIFSESPEFAVKMAGNYSLDLEACWMNTQRRFDYLAADPVYKDYMPNPHLKFFECLGGYKTQVSKALKDRNFISAIEMCIASAGSVDLDETEQTFRPFIGFLLSSKDKVLRRRDGVDMTPEEALLYLIDKENK